MKRSLPPDIVPNDGINHLADDLPNDLHPVVGQWMDAPTLHAIRRACKAFYGFYTPVLEAKVNWFAEPWRTTHRGLIFRALSPPSQLCLKKSTSKTWNTQISILVAGYVKQGVYSGEEINSAVGVIIPPKLSSVDSRATWDDSRDDYDENPTPKSCVSKIIRAILSELIIQGRDDAWHTFVKAVDVGKIDVGDVCKWLSIRHGGIPLLTREHLLQHIAPHFPTWDSKGYPILFDSSREGDWYINTFTYYILRGHYAEHVLDEYASKDPMKYFQEAREIFPVPAFEQSMVKFDVGKVPRVLFERHPDYLFFLLEHFAGKPGCGFLYRDPDYVQTHFNEMHIYNPPVEWNDFLRYLFESFFKKGNDGLVQRFARIPWCEKNARVIRNIFTWEFVQYVEEGTWLPNEAICSAAALLKETNLLTQDLVSHYSRRHFLEAVMKGAIELIPTKIEIARLLAVPDSPQMIKMMEAYQSMFL